jgi:two-component system chemotaxis response regulator CheY
MKHVLIIDDAATVRMYHRLLLEQSGFIVDEAINGIEGLEKALCRRYDLFVVDVNMPKMDGYLFLRELRTLEAVYQAPALMVSTESEDKDRMIAFASGANFYVVKPAKPGELGRAARLLTGGPT